MAQRTEIRLCGTGGQGLVLAGVILAEAAGVHRGLNAVQTATITVYTRGTPSRCEVIISDGEIDYPLLRSPDIVVALSQSAADRYTADLREGGVLIVDPLFVPEIPAVRAQVYRVPVTELADNIGKRVAANMVALGALVKLTGLLPLEDVEKALLARVPRGTEELNRRALHAGYEAAAAL